MSAQSFYTQFLSRRALRYQESAIRALMPLSKAEGMISLAGGLPNPKLFPITELKTTLRTGEEITMSSRRLQDSLQYSASYGLPDLVAWLKDYQKDLHSPPRSHGDWNICVTSGSQDGLYKAMDMLVDENDHILVEEPAYSGIVAALRPLHCNVVTVETDRHGIIPESLEKILEGWPKETHSSRPRILYTIPTGQNPSGATMTEERRRKVYSIAQRFNLLVLEDDAYFHLQYVPQEERPKSLFSMDDDGRVLRFDSFSKVIASGLRIGWVTGPTELVDRLQLMQQASVMHASGLSQGLVLTILESMGRDGLNAHLAAVQEEYRQRRDKFCELAEKHLTGLAEWSVPEAGMFVWFKLVGVIDSFGLIKNEALNEKVLLVPGASFSFKKEPSPYVRASFSVASYEDMDRGLERLANLLRKHTGK
mmetsp:Transcript_25787/g.72225  ORF Transcript_25787/g.72225 Transcript_25787/m.72225 type:complete len:422 (+) Transcript_25787:59-1324(+)|eukprot:CAMPEP_0119132340 /NCGR_PEP_ID=MMETSP1310-20130426/11785_1 /TAXON_ID=464262 /ORGANISM="Genus nov. species nov., Strain RCC2339" /LENGTH=421 /DNA_ID=CAMNT_0007122967 /DNA_START=55 /DNA_END=1320 /DNA_ORIENTATION=-